MTAQKLMTKEDFGEGLQSLKEEGASILTVGQAPPRVFEGAARRAFGNARKDRYRVLVLTTPRQAPEDYLPEGVDTTDDGVEVIRARVGGPRSASAQSSDETQGALREVESDIYAAVGGAQRRAEDEGRELESKEVRVVVASLLPLIRRHDSEEVRRLLTSLSGLVHSVSGYGFHQIGRAPDSEVVKDLMEGRDLFDARIEVRHAHGEPGPQQRWLLPEQGVSGWMDLG